MGRINCRRACCWLRVLRDGLLQVKRHMDPLATTCFFGKALMVEIMGVVLGRHQASEAIRNLFANACN